MLYIDPADCIDCEACVPECPVEAIFAEANVPMQIGRRPRIESFTNDGGSEGKQADDPEGSIAQQWTQKLAQADAGRVIFEHI